MNKGTEEYKKTAIGDIPLHWEIVSLKQVIKNFIVPMRDKPKQFQGDIPWCRIEDLQGKWLNSSKSNQGVNAETVSNMNLKIMPSGTVICSCSATLGVCAITTTPLITNQTFIGLYPGEKVDKEYLYYVMGFNAKKLQSLSSGTTIAYLSRKQFEEFYIPLPSLLEQKKIASVLSSVDEAIEKIEAIIEQTEKVKKGLMQQLLTKGIGHTKFKKTEIGDIPKDWECKTLGEILEVCQYGLSDALSLEQKGFPVLRMGNLQNGIIDTGNLKYLDVPEGNVKDFLLENGDILFNRTNSEELVGKTSIFQEDFPCSFASYLIRLRPKKNKIDSNFLNYYMNSGAGQNRIRRYIALGVSQCNISASNLKKVYIPIPNIEEQKKIVNIVCSSDKKIEVEKRRLSRLQRLKQGLMPSLLMGKVRVKVDEVEVTQV